MVFRLIFGLLGAIGGLVLVTYILGQTDWPWYVTLSFGAFAGTIISNVFTQYVKGVELD